MSLIEAVESALAELPADGRDTATIALARKYAEAIDLGGEEGDLSKLGPKLLDCLEALLLSPRVRAALVKGKDHGPRSSPVDELRRRRRARGAAAVDPSTS